MRGVLLPDLAHFMRRFWRGSLSELLPRLLSCVLFGILMTLSGCASTPKSYVVLLPSPDGSVGKVIVSGAQGEQVLDQAGQTAPLDGSAARQAPAKEQIDKDFADAVAARPKLPVHYLVYFGTGTALTPDSLALIPQIVVEARSRAAVDVSVIGHTDTIQTAEYNEQLALNRAKAVVDLLKARGLNANSISVESHGKRNLLVPTPDNTYEPRNRRVEISIR
ncbi:OmpA family protein [Niveibacterium sp. SC-1]|uniref:OmpA family protein n=1 Tax=Niveibacterium sp. SC-1 TaxID=3135646 RepID=UPI00311EAF52